MSDLIVQLHGCPVTVEFVEDPIDCGIVVSGLYTHEDHLIQINSERPITLQRTALLHELIHSSHAMVLGITQEYIEEERATSAAEVGVFGLFTDPRNEWVKDFIIDGKKPSIEEEEDE